MKKLLIPTLTMSLFACGGGGSDSTEKEVIQPPPASIMPAGVWVGTVTQGGEIFEAAGMVAPDGEARFITDGGEQTSLMLTLDGGSFSATGKSYTNDGDYIGVGSASGSFTAATIAGQTESNGEVLSTFTFGLSSVTADGASFEVIKGNYTDLNQVTSVAIDEDGIITGSSIDGCIIEGAVTIPQSDINIYKLAWTVSTCDDLNGDYSGLATYAQLFDDIEDKALIVQVESDHIIITDLLVK